MSPPGDTENGSDTPQQPSDDADRTPRGEAPTTRTDAAGGPGIVAPLTLTLAGVGVTVAALSLAHVGEGLSGSCRGADCRAPDQPVGFYVAESVGVTAAIVGFVWLVGNLRAQGDARAEPSARAGRSVVVDVRVAGGRGALTLGGRF